MDPTPYAWAALCYVGSCVGKQTAEASVALAWDRLAESFQRWRGRAPKPADATTGVAGEQLPQDLLQQATFVLGQSSALRRAQRVSDVLKGAKVLWADDQPENNAWERSLLTTLGVQVLTVETTRSALASLNAEQFDVIISDISRGDAQDEGVRALPQVAAVTDAPVVFYVGAVKPTGVPHGAFGITAHPNELLHLVLDCLERTRV